MQHWRYADVADSRVNRVWFDVVVKREDFEGVHTDTYQSQSYPDAYDHYRRACDMSCTREAEMIVVVQHTDWKTDEITEMSGTLQLYVTGDCEERELSMDESVVTAL